MELDMDTVYVATLELLFSNVCVPPFLLMQNLFSKDIARYDIMKLKVS